MIDRSHGRVWIDTVGYTDSDNTAFSTIAGVGIQPVPALELEGMLPFGIISGTSSDTLLGNPFIAGSYLLRKPNLRARFGAGVALPVVDVDSFDEAATLIVSAGIRGLENPWLWAEDALGVVGFTRIEGDASEIVSLTLDAAFAELVPVRDRDEAETVVQVAPGFALRAGRVFSAGLRGVFVVIPTADGDNAQVSLEPFVRGNFGPGFVSARFTYNVDEPLGPSFDDDKLWGVGVGAGVAF